MKGEAPLVLDRTEAYTAILIDDLISKGTNEPYRMFTSRAEFRLHLRIDNADRRLTPHGRRVGLIGDEAWAAFQAKQQRQAELTKLLERTRATSQMLQAIANLEDCHPERSRGSPPWRTTEDEVEGSRFSREQAAAEDGRATPALQAAVGSTLAQLLKRPEITIEHLLPLLQETGRWPLTTDHLELKSVETEIKYEGYLKQQERAIERLKKSEQRAIPEWFDYLSVSGLSREMKEKLQRVRPQTLAQASRIPGVTPAAVSLVNVFIEIQARRHQQAAGAR
ncbi:MAG: hypothetical protein ACREU7_08525 [Burkholderiales bacterium]